MRATSKPLGKAMYVASEPDREWLRIERKKLYTRSWKHPEYVFCKLWGLVTDPRNLRVALARVASNRGRRTAGVDGITVRVVVANGVDAFVEHVRAELRAGTYRPNPVRRVLIPKAGQPGKFRPLGIPTVKDRVVQAAMKNVLEPVFEAGFYPNSYGFRPGKSVHGALEHLRVLLRPRVGGPESERRLPYQWAIEGDIKGCFDNIDHHALMVRVRRRIGDAKVNRLVLAFLRSGVLSEDQFLRTNAGTPQGGILSPLLANIALSAIEERYERHAWPRRAPMLLTDPAAIERRGVRSRSYDRERGRLILYPVRYADDFLVFVSVPPGPGQDERARQAALAEKDALSAFLKEQLNLTLSETKTLVTSVTQPIRFLGHHVRVRIHPTHGRMVSMSVIPKERSQRMRRFIKRLFRATTAVSLANRLLRLNPMLRGWSYFYRHAWGAKRVLQKMDHYVWWCIWRWLKKKHKGASARRIAALHGWKKPNQRSLRWRDGDVVPFEAQSVRVQRFFLGWQRTPDFAQDIYGEPGA